MQSRPLRERAAFPRNQAFWLGAAVLMAGQLAAFWMLCSQQVRKAEVRNAALQAQRLALADCLRYVPGATLNGCAARVAPLERTTPALAATAPAAVPVNYVYR